MITKIKTSNQPQVSRILSAPTIVGLLLALLSPTLLILLSTYMSLGFIGAELLFWGIAVAILVIVLSWERKPLASIGFRRFAFKDLLWALGFAVVIFFSFPAIYWVLSQLDFPVATEIAKAISSLPIPVLVLLALRAGVTEEIIYRGFLIERLLSFTQSKTIAMVLPLLVFILSHMNWGLSHLIFVTIAGALLTLMYLWKRNLWLNIITHFLVDISLFLVMPAWLESV